MDIFDNSVLVVVDMQNGFLNHKSEHVIPNVVNLVKIFEERDRPVVFTRFHNQIGSPYETLIGWRRLRESPEIDLTDELKPFATTVIDKDFYSSFTNEFEDLLNHSNWTTIVLCGVATESCVMKTAVDAFERGLRPLVISDACASHAGEAIHQAGLTILGRFIGDKQIIKTSELLQFEESRGV